MRRAETAGFTWHRRWTAPDYLKLVAFAVAVAYGGMRVFGQV
jgi:hypothetical protein